METQIKICFGVLLQDVYPGLAHGLGISNTHDHRIGGVDSGSQLSTPSPLTGNWAMSFMLVYYIC